MEDGVIPLPGQMSVKLLLWAPQMWREPTVAPPVLDSAAAAGDAAQTVSTGSEGVAADMGAAADGAQASGAKQEEDDEFDLRQKARRKCVVSLGSVQLQSGMTLAETKLVASCWLLAAGCWLLTEAVCLCLLP